MLVRAPLTCRKFARRRRTRAASGSRLNSRQAGLFPTSARSHARLLDARRSHALVGSSRLSKIAHLRVTRLDPAKMVPATELGPMTLRDGTHDGRRNRFPRGERRQAGRSALQAATEKILSKLGGWLTRALQFQSCGDDYGERSGA